MTRQCNFFYKATLFSLILREILFESEDDTGRLTTTVDYLIKRLEERPLNF